MVGVSGLAYCGTGEVVVKLSRDTTQIESSSLTRLLFVSAMSGEADGIGDVPSSTNGTGGELSFPQIYFLKNNLTEFICANPNLIALPHLRTNSCLSVG
jgi:hypothetical protein